MSNVSELFEKVSHPTRVKILVLLDTSPLNFSQLKGNLGIVSSGNLDHHLKKLENLIYLDSDGLYKVSDEGKEAIRAIRSIESSLTSKETYTIVQSSRIFGVLLIILVVFIFTVTICTMVTIPKDMTTIQTIGLLGGITGSVIGILGAAIGLKGSIMVDARSGLQITYFPSRKDPWSVGDWVFNLLFFSSYLILMFLLIYVQISVADFSYKGLWFLVSLFALITLSISSASISHRIIEKANRKIGKLSLPQ